MDQTTDSDQTGADLPPDLARLPYRPCVGIMLINHKGEVFVAQRIDTTVEAWQMPQGGIDRGETPRQAALRELKEEVGTDNAAIIAESRDWLRYDLPAALIPRVWKGRYRGQEQKWFAMRFLGEDSEIDIETDDPEFTTWRWAALESLPDLIVPFKRRIYQDLVTAFRDVAVPSDRASRTDGPSD